VSCYARCELYIADKDEFRKLVLVDEFKGRPVYMDEETGEMYCPFDNKIPAFHPRPESAEYGLWTRIKRYWEEVLRRIWP